MSTHTPTSTAEITRPNPAKTLPSMVANPELLEYMNAMSLHQSPSQLALRVVVNSHPAGGMSASPDESQYLAWMVKLIGAKRVIEVGVFLGATTLAIAEALPADGKIVALDVSEEFTSVGAKFWEAAGVRDKIDLRLAPGVDTLKALIDANEAGTYDMAFIDADKSNYDHYFEHCLTLLRAGGVIAIDNVFFHARTLDESRQDPDTVAIRTLNKKLFSDSRVDITTLPIADGVTLCRKL